MMPTTAPFAVRMSGITKRFPGVTANDNVSLSIYKNEILALLGENGAGKSTLMSILFGSYEADAGTIEIEGKEVKIKNPNEARALGIGMVHQHFKLVANYTVAENIVLGAEPVNKFGLLDIASAEKKVAELSELYGLKVNARAKIEDITVGMQQRVEILKTLYRSARIIIFDEPSAVLTPQEIDELLEIISRLKNEGKTIVLITHKLKEVKAVADRCAVLRRGKLIDIVQTKDVSEAELAGMMVGRAVNFGIEKAPPKTGDVVLSIENISVRDTRGHLAVQNFSLEARAGEITGIAGVDGNGQQELIFALTGMLPLESGRVMFRPRGASRLEDISNMPIRRRIENGLGFVPEDRRKHAIISEFNIGFNVVLKNYYKTPYTRNVVLLDEGEIYAAAEKLIAGYDIRAARGARTPLGSMSGGNQQKAVIAREILLSPVLLIAAQPTRGLDVGAIEYIRKRLVEERDGGRAVLLISFELDEVMNLCDKIAAISKGAVAGIFNAGEVSERELGMMMGGGTRDKR